ncbi:Uncharacterized protein APZ42_013039, partial [Daphnia magna]
RSHSVSENPKLLSNAVPSIFVGVFDAPNNSGTPPLEEELLEPPTKKIRLSYVVTHEFDGDLPVSEDAVVGVQEIHNPPNHIAVNGSGDEEKDSANDSGPVRDISASKLSESEGDFHISSHHSDSGCHYSSSTSFNSDSECEWSASNSCDSDSECAWSSSNSSDTNSDWELSSQEDCDTDSDFQENELDHLETPDSDNDALLRPKPASSTENDLKLQKKVRRLQKQIVRLKKNRGKLENRISDLENTISGLTCPEMNLIKSMKKESTEGDPWSCFMMDQMKNKTKKSKNGYRWHQEVIRQCIILQARSPGAYECLRKSGMVILPSPKTLRSYLGSSTMDVGVTDIVKEAMKAKIEELGGGLGIHVNIALDEVAIKPNETYVKHADKLVGHVDMAGIVEAKDKEKLANKLLTFAINGLANSFCIIVGYFLVNKMTAEELSKLTLHVIEEVERIGFVVVGAVADNASTNTKMFKMINPDRILSHVIPHPNDANRKLFLSFDSSHIIKNVRNQFIDRPLKRKGKPIRFEFIKRLHFKQKLMVLKFVKKLSKRHLEPTTIERQNVQRALDIFSRPMVAALEALRRRHTSGFMGSEETISFMCKMIKWFEIHDISNLTQGKYQRLPNKAPFYSSADARVKWLQDFLQWLIDWKKSVIDKEHFLTAETFAAIEITTKSTIAKISYLLDTAGFKFVLTRKFNSDNLERKFSALRQANGGNYNMEAKAAIYGVEKLLRTTA